MMSREERLEYLLSYAIQLLDLWDELALETGQEPDGYGSQRAVLQVAYEAIKTK